MKQVNPGGLKTWKFFICLSEVDMNGFGLATMIYLSEEDI